MKLQSQCPHAYTFFAFSSTLLLSSYHLLIGGPAGLALRDEELL